jgi:DNA-binding transcriptional regulator YiaG
MGVASDVNIWMVVTRVL